MIGIVIGLVAAWIDIVAAWLTDFKQGVCITEWYLSKDICCTGPLALMDTVSVTLDHGAGWIFGAAESNVFSTLCSMEHVIFAGCSALMVARLANYAAGSGAAEIKTILGGFIIKEFLDFPLAVASGLAVGKEGPMVHIACSIGNIFPRLFPKYKDNEARKREILSASAAAGIAVAFGSPIGGVLSSLGGNSNLKGLTGALVIRCNLWFQALRRNDPWFKSNPVREVIGIALLTAIVGYMNVFTRIDNLELLETLFKEADMHSDSIGRASGSFMKLMLMD
ncbi:hypothetical protein BSLG_003606 [Batrachochytrium salamandrivorans]|nr:hypothetical protein BSLG_003606 [Batrachochytrium salamandrivorans]